MDTTYEEEENLISVTASIGIACYPNDGELTYNLWIAQIELVMKLKQMEKIIISFQEGYLKSFLLIE